MIDIFYPINRCEIVHDMIVIITVTWVGKTLDGDPLELFIVTKLSRAPLKCTIWDVSQKKGIML